MIRLLTSGPALETALACALTVFLLAAPIFLASPEEPLREQDIVRMVVAGRPASEIIEEIRTRPVRFDLSDEMVEELRIAGVPEPVIDAMRQRAAEFVSPVSSPPQAVEEPGASVTVRIRPLSAASSGNAVVWFPANVPAERARILDLGPTDEERTVKDLAVFLACLTPEHVPDQWRSRSPLGRDFVAMPRHEMLALHAGGKRIEAHEVPRAIRSRFRDSGSSSNLQGWLRFELPGSLSATVEHGQSHRLLLGVAALVGERYLLLASTGPESVDVPAGGLTREAEIGQNPDAAAELRVRFLPASGAEPIDRR